MPEDTDHEEIARIKRLQKQMREREERKFANPDAEPELEWIWVCHVWVANNPKDQSVGEWVFAGFRRHRNRRKPQSMNGFFSKIRRKFGIDKKSPVTVRDLRDAAKLMRSRDQSWRMRPPQFQKRKAKVVQRTPLPVGKTTKRRAPKRAYKLDRRSTKFIALGRNPWDRAEGYLYCGPLESVFRSDAVREAERTFRSHKEILVVKVSDLSKPLRNQMHSGKRIRAGVARIIWPEPVPEFDPLWSKLVKSGKAQALESDQYYDIKKVWLDADCPWLSLGWLRKAIKKHTPSTGDASCSTSKDSASSLKAASKRKSAERKSGRKATLPSSATKSFVRSSKRVAARRRPAAMRVRPQRQSVRTRR